MDQHLVIRASAGSGKTFRLSNRCLDLLFKGVAPQNILAVTFTRKAAGEILDRILLRLAKGALTQEGCRDLSQAVYGSPDLLNQDQVLDKLAELARNLHLLRVSTLDSFFSALARSFAPELGLPIGWQIVDEPAGDQIRSQAVLSVLSEPDKKNVRELIRNLFKGEASRSLSRELLDLTGGTLKLFRETEESAWKGLGLKTCSAKSEREAKAGLIPHVLQNTPKVYDSRLLKAVDTFLKLYNSDTPESSLNPFSTSILFGKNTYYRKEIPEPLFSELQYLIDDARSHYLNMIQVWTNATYETASLISEADSEIRKLSGKYEIDDIPRFLAKRVKNLDQEQINYRLDAKTTHILLDEFQDTSLLQWQILRPLAEFITDGYAEETEKSFFCVGDTKQSIYGWRSGIPEIFDVVEKLPRIRKESLDKNWRSSPVILDTVNKIFSGIASNPIFAGGKTDNPWDALRSGAYQEAASEWEKNYLPHTAGRPDTPGFVSLESAPRYTEETKQEFAELLKNISDSDEDDIEAADSDTKKQNRLTDAYTVKRIADLHRAYPNASIGVLFRSNAKAAFITAGLARYGIEASQEGGVPLSVSKSVRAILALLRLADHPGDTAAVFRAATLEPLSRLFGLTPDQIGDAVLVKNLSLQIREKMMTDGLGSFVRELTDSLLPFCDMKEVPKLRALTEQAFKFEQENEPRIDRFIETAEKVKLKLPTASNVHLQTVHGSKGLEFDIVVLPELDKDFIRFSKNLLVHRPAPTEPADMITRWKESGDYLLFPKEMKIEETLHTELKSMMNEALNILYVAMTRAVHELVMIVSPNVKDEYRSLKAGHLLRNGLVSAKSESFPPPLGFGEEILYADGDPDWYAKSDISAVSPQGDTAASLISRKAAPVLSRAPRVSHRPPSDKGYSRSWHDSSRLFDRGTAIHACFERVEWLDVNGMPDRNQIVSFLETQFYRGISAIDIFDEFRQMLSDPETASLLSRSAYQTGSETPIHAGGVQNPAWEVYPERSFLVPIPNSSGYTKGRIDRLVLLKDGDRTVGADIVDFKTDRIIPEEGSAEWEAYARQLRAYQDAVRRLTGLPADKISARLAFVTHGKVIPVKLQ